MSELIPGGLALVLKAKRPTNIGKCVTTKRIVRPDESVITPDGMEMHNWTSKTVWYITGDVTTEFFSGRIGVGYGLLPASYLLPINPETVDEKEAEEVA